MDFVKIFHSVLGDEQKHDSIIGAISATNSTFLATQSLDSNEERYLEVFFEENNAEKPQAIYYAIMDFWAKIEPYIWNFPSEELKQFQIIKIIQNLEIIRQVKLLNYIIDHETPEHIYALQKLADSIEDMPDKKFMIEMTVDGDIKALYSLKHFDEQCYHAYRDFILQRLSMLLKSRGEIVVAAGKDKIYEYLIDDYKWEVTVSNKQNIIEKDQEATRRGLIRGFVSSDLW